MIERLTALLAERDAEVARLREALRDAKQTIHDWHGDAAWDIYERSSPEMKRLNAALALCERQQEGE
jgi:hypothetical protein